MTIAKKMSNPRGVATVVAILAGLCVWYAWPSETVAGVERRIRRDVPEGTSREKAEEWLQREGIEYSYSQDFEYNSILEQNHIGPEQYSGYTASIIRDTDRGLFVTGSIQIYFFFDKNERVAGHVVRWIGTGL